MRNVASMRQLYVQLMHMANYIPSFFIFPRVKMNRLFLDQAPPSSQSSAQISGWMTMELLKKYMEHFCKFVKPIISKPVELILDGHCSHTRSIDVLDYASQNGVVVLAQPHHTTRRLHPLDIGFSSHFKLITTNSLNVGCAFIPDAHLQSTK